MLDHPFLLSAAGELVLHAPSASGHTPTTIARNVRWPAWSPGGDAAACSRVEPGPDGVRARVELIGVEGGTRLATLHEGAAGAPLLIAPGVPHYCLWSPDGEVLSYVAPTAGGLALFLSRRDGQFTSRQLVTSAPVFLCWAPGSNQLVAHVGNSLRWFDASGMTLPEPTGREATGFRAPAISPDGRVLLFAEASPPTVSLLALAKDAANVQTVGEFSGSLALGFRPGRDAQASVAVARANDPNTFTELLLVDLSGRAQGRRRLWTGPFVAATWDPTGRHVALVVPTQSGDGRYAVLVLDDRGRTVAQTEGFLPSADLRLYLSFFDQYSLSHHIWSPDGRYLALAGRLAGDGVSSAFGDPQDYVFLWEVGRGAPLELIGPGGFAVFPPPVRAPER